MPGGYLLASPSESLKKVLKPGEKVEKAGGKIILKKIKEK